MTDTQVYERLLQVRACAVAIRASWADDAAAQLDDMVTYDTQSGAVRLDGGQAA